MLIKQSSCEIWKHVLVSVHGFFRKQSMQPHSAKFFMKRCHGWNPDNSMNKKKLSSKKLCYNAKERTCINWVSYTKEPKSIFQLDNSCSFQTLNMLKATTKTQKLEHQNRDWNAEESMQKSKMQNDHWAKSINLPEKRKERKVKNKGPQEQWLSKKIERVSFLQGKKFEERKGIEEKEGEVGGRNIRGRGGFK